MRIIIEIPDAQKVQVSTDETVVSNDVPTFSVGSTAKQMMRKYHRYMLKQAEAAYGSRKQALVALDISEKTAYNWENGL